MRKILLIATGGTIASAGSEEGLVPQMDIPGILCYVPDILDKYEVGTLPLMNIDSSNMGPQHWLLIAKAIERNYNSYDGFIILHGTDTMAYTAAALSYLCRNLGKPVVLTGAQMPISESTSDGKKNLINSFTYAGFEKAFGVVIVFDGKVIAGTRARKTRSKSYNAFSSIDFPELAVIRDDKVIRYIRAVKPEDPPVFDHHLDGRIFPLKLIPGMSAGIFDSLYQDYDAVIMESFGVGGIPEVTDGGKAASGDEYGEAGGKTASGDEYGEAGGKTASGDEYGEAGGKTASGDEYGEAGGKAASEDEFGEKIGKWTASGKVLVVTTQVPHEGSDMTIYRVGLHIKERYGVLEAFDMTYEAIVTKLMWILGRTHEPERIKKLFYTPVNYDLVSEEA